MKTDFQAIRGIQLHITMRITTPLRMMLWGIF